MHHLAILLLPYWLLTTLAIIAACLHFWRLRFFVAVALPDWIRILKIGAWLLVVNFYFYLMMDAQHQVISPTTIALSRTAFASVMVTDILTQGWIIAKTRKARKRNI